MSEQPTPGHGGKVCPGLGLAGQMHIRSAGFGWEVVDGRGEWRLTISHCPWCPTRLVPDPEPLPKCPEGHEPAFFLAMFPNGVSQIFCQNLGGFKHFFIEESTHVLAESRWRKTMAALNEAP